MAAFTAIKLSVRGIQKAIKKVSFRRSVLQVMTAESVAAKSNYNALSAQLQLAANTPLPPIAESTEMSTAIEKRKPVAIRAFCKICKMCKKIASTVGKRRQGVAKNFDALATQLQLAASTPLPDIAGGLEEVCTMPGASKTDAAAPKMKPAAVRALRKMRKICKKVLGARDMAVEIAAAKQQLQAECALMHLHATECDEDNRTLASVPTASPSEHTKPKQKLAASRAFRKVKKACRKLAEGCKKSPQAADSAALSQSRTTNVASVAIKAIKLLKALKR